MAENAQIKAELLHKTPFLSHAESLTRQKKGKSKDD